MFLQYKMVSFSSKFQNIFVFTITIIVRDIQSTSENRGARGKIDAISPQQIALGNRGGGECGPGVPRFPKVHWIYQ